MRQQNCLQPALWRWHWLLPCEWPFAWIVHLGCRLLYPWFWTENRSRLSWVKSSRLQPLPEPSRSLNCWSCSDPLVGI